MKLIYSIIHFIILLVYSRWDFLKVILNRLVRINNRGLLILVGYNRVSCYQGLPSSRPCFLVHFEVVL